jgi:hypothetical protein
MGCGRTPGDPDHHALFHANRPHAVLVFCVALDFAKIPRQVGRCRAARAGDGRSGDDAAPARGARPPARQLQKGLCCSAETPRDAAGAGADARGHLMGDARR